ncbi:unnamed protein product [Brassica rapa subsp. narinosa]
MLAGKEYYDSSEQVSYPFYISFRLYFCVCFLFVVYPSRLNQVENRQADPPRSISICSGLIYMGENITSGPYIFPFCQPIKFKEHNATKNLKMLKPVVQ